MKNRIFPLMNFFLLMMLSFISVSEAVASSSDTEFTARIKNNACSISGVTDYNIGSIGEGIQTYFPAFKLKIECGTSTVNTELYANVLNGTLDDPYTVIMGNTKKDISMRLHLPDERNSSVYFDSSQPFCAGDKTRVCTIEPFIKLWETDDVGDFSASISFTLKHP
ncbi:hypothetical protein [Citrobacter meridianamericanus]|uniref:Fimbrial protein n=1 Tax=Citrobacter meridianamericanus TaxID=2894201 RepID=A0ABT1BEG7_9ENTR|nr:hypothetical protein [Citrobacter meridianamericanus]MCO5784261.1 hypothetical protein [Citrobacter meridianamericanus]